MEAIEAENYKQEAKFSQTSSWIKDVETTHGVIVTNLALIKAHLWPILEICLYKSITI